MTAICLSVSSLGPSSRRTFSLAAGGLEVEARFAFVLSSLLLRLLPLPAAQHSWPLVSVGTPESRVVKHRQTQTKRGLKGGDLALASSLLAAAADLMAQDATGRSAILFAASAASLQAAPHGFCFQPVL